MHFETIYEKNVAMTAETKKILDEIRPELLRIAPKGAKVLLFGSRARGDERPDSDFDILVLLKRKGKSLPEDNMGLGYDINTLFWKRDRDVGTVVQTEDEWEKQSFSLFYDNVMNGSVRLI